MSRIKRLLHRFRDEECDNCLQWVDSLYFCSWCGDCLDCCTCEDD